MATQQDQTFALCFGNRFFFPEHLIAAAQQELAETVTRLGYKSLVMPADTTPNGAVGTTEDGVKYARFLAENRGRYQGVILCLPNFSDENAAIAALQDCGVPILIQAYPDELDKMGFSLRRDAFCGKFSIMDVFCQCGLPFTIFSPHTVHPGSGRFQQNLNWFAGVCRVVGRMRRCTVGAIGARTTAFKTVRFDELTLQRYGITTEVLDLSDVIQRVQSLSAGDQQVKDKIKRLSDYTNWSGVPDEALQTLARLGVVLDQVIEEYQMDALAIRCWIELQKQLKIAPCVLLSEMNDRGIPAACELDVCNAIPMMALSEASRQPAMCLDWNNNYGEDDDKCILFHCGPVAQQLMTGKGQVVDNPFLAKATSAGCAWGSNVGRIAPDVMTYASSKTQDGKLVFYLDEGQFTNDPIAEDFFGCAGVAQIKDLQKKLELIGHHGYRHHVSVTAGYVATPIREAFGRYLGYEVMEL